MRIDCHAHFSAPDSLYSLKSMLLASRGAAGKGQFPKKLSRENIKAHVEGGGSSVHGVKGHLEYMDEAGTDIQLLSPRPYQMMHSESPPEIVVMFAEECNNVTHKQCEIWPDRFIGIASLPQVAGEPMDLAIAELQRCIGELGFVGALINPDPFENGGTEPAPMGDRYWYPLYEKLCELDVPGYIHGCGSRSRRQPYSMNFIAEETTAILNLVNSEVFVDFPELKIVVSHGGGGIPYQLGRFDAASSVKTKGKGPLFSDKLKKLYFDTVLYSQNAMELLIKEIGPDNLVMGSELPGTGTAIDPRTGKQFDDVGAYIDNIEWLSTEDKNKIFYENAVRLFKLGAIKPRLSR
jgi:predicted TIM-barrel fold metal-dependent hydrolase